MILAGKRLLGRSRDNINVYLSEIVWENVYCIHLIRDSDQWRVLVKTIMNLPVP
jgi:hypothetical protein